jgi:hypothetical protein
MANSIIQLKRSAVAGNVPNPNMFSDGELILNYADGNLFFKAANTNVHRIGGKSAPSFGTVLAGGNSLVADDVGASLRFIAGENISINGIVGNDAIAISATLTGGAGNVMAGGPSNTSDIVLFNDTSGKNLIDSGIMFTSNGKVNMMTMPVDVGAGNTALCINSSVTMTGAGSKLFCVANRGVEKFYIDPSGNVYVAGNMTVQNYIDMANGIITAPSSGNSRLHLSAMAGSRPRWSSMAASGRKLEYQEHLGDISRYEYIPIRATAAPTLIGIATPTVVGTNIPRQVAANNALWSRKRTGYISATTTASVTEIRSTASWLLRANGPANIGFYYTTTIGISEVPPSSCAIAAFTLTNVTTAYAATSNLTSLRTFFGFGCDRGNSTLKWASSNTAGPANTIELGANFPVQNNAIYQFKIYCPPYINGESNVYWSCERFDEPAYAEGVANPAFLPANSAFLTFHHMMSNGVAAQNTGFDLINFYIEHPN